MKAQKIAEQNSLNSQQTAGKLYVTVPLLQGKNIYPHEIVTIKGFLYKPQSPKNNIQFNFKKYHLSNQDFYNPIDKKMTKVRVYAIYLKK